MRSSHLIDEASKDARCKLLPAFRHAASNAVHLIILRRHAAKHNSRFSGNNINVVVVPSCPACVATIGPVRCTTEEGVEALQDGVSM